MGRKCYIGRVYVYKKGKESSLCHSTLSSHWKKINIIYGKNLVNILLVKIGKEGTAPAAKYQVGSLAS